MNFIHQITVNQIWLFLNVIFKLIHLRIKPSFSKFGDSNQIQQSKSLHFDLLVKIYILKIYILSTLLLHT